MAADPKQTFEYSKFRYHWMHAHTWKMASIVGFLTGSVISAAMTFMDWWLNPSSLFHDERGTDWTVVTETALSWLGPTALAAFLATAVVLYVIAWIKNR